MDTQKRKLTVKISAVIIYYILAFGGFSLLRHFGVSYVGPKIHIFAVPMMAVISLYVFLLNGKRILRKNDFAAKKENLLLYIIPYIVVIAVIFSIIETILTGRSLPDILCMVVLTFFIGISEEGMFRLFLLNDQDGSSKEKLFLFLFSVIAFGALHMMNVGGGLSLNDAFIQSISAIPFGIVAGLLYSRTGNISALVFWHMFFDYDLFAEQQGIFISTTVFGFAVDIILFISMIWAIISIVSEYRKSRK